MFLRSRLQIVNGERPSSNEVRGGASMPALRYHAPPFSHALLACGSR